MFGLSLVTSVVCVVVFAVLMIAVGVTIDYKFGLGAKALKDAEAIKSDAEKDASDVKADAEAALSRVENFFKALDGGADTKTALAASGVSVTAPEVIALPAESNAAQTLAVIRSVLQAVEAGKTITVEGTAFAPVAAQSTGAK